MQSPIAVPRRLQHAGEGRRVGTSRHTTKPVIKLRNTPPSQRRIRTKTPSPKNTSPVAHSPPQSPHLVPSSPYSQDSPVNNSPVPSSPPLEAPLSPIIGSNFATAFVQSLLRPSLSSTSQLPTTTRTNSPPRLSPDTNDKTKKRHQLQEESEEEEVLSPPPKAKRTLVTPNHVNKTKEPGKAKKQKQGKSKTGETSKSKGKDSAAKAKKKAPKSTPRADDSIYSDEVSDTISLPDEQADTTQARRRIALGRNDQVLEFVLAKIMTISDEYMEEEDCSEVQPILDIWKAEITSSFEEYQEQARENSALSRNLKMLVKARKEIRREILVAKKELYNAQQAILQEEAAYRKSEAERISKENLHAFLTNFDILMQTPLSEKSQVATDNVESFLATVADNGHNLSRVRAINQTLQDCSNLLDVLAST